MALCYLHVMNTHTATGEIMNTQRDELAAIIASHGYELDMAHSMIASFTDAEIAKTLASFAESAHERDELRTRLQSDELLRRTICPATSWLTADDRYDVARRALKLVESVCAQHSVDLHELCAELVEARGTVADTIDMHGDDPRIVQWGSSFYAFRWRLRDALEVAKRSEKRAAHERKIAAMLARGDEPCTRCGGAGASEAWRFTGSVCYDCGGSGVQRVASTR